jgi:hypothetical protein
MLLVGELCTMLIIQYPHIKGKEKILENQKFLPKTPLFSTTIRYIIAKSLHYRTLKQF